MSIAGVNRLNITADALDALGEDFNVTVPAVLLAQVLRQAVATEDTASPALELAYYLYARI